MKPQSFIIRLEVFPFDILFSINQSDAQLRKKLSKLTDNIEQFDGIFEDFKARTLIVNSGETVIRINNIKYTSHFAGTLAHEIFHAVTFILDRINLEFNIDHNDEAYAYCIGYVTTKVYEKLITD